jgi:hypothetical protein
MHACAYDSVGARYFVHSGLYEDGIGTQFWSASADYQEDEWYRYSDVSEARMGHTLTWDKRGSRLLMFGGGNQVDGACFNATYNLPITPVGSWSQLTTTGTSPKRRAYHSIIYDKMYDRLVVFGGVDTIGVANHGNNESWAMEFGRPEPLTIAVDEGSGGGALVYWTAPDSDLTCGPAVSYDLRRSLSPITEANFCSGTPVQVSSMPSPASPGTGQSKLVSGLGDCHEYYFAMRVGYQRGCWSSISNAVTFDTQCEGGFSAPIEVTGIPIELQLASPRPNPARSSAHLAYGIPMKNRGERLTLTVYDALGRQVRTLRKEAAAPGVFDVEWDSQDQAGRSVRPGVYFVRLAVGNWSQTATLSITK